LGEIHIGKSAQAAGRAEGYLLGPKGRERITSEYAKTGEPSAAQRKRCDYPEQSQ
jgi:hypothetical protein